MLLVVHRAGVRGAMLDQDSDREYAQMLFERTTNRGAVFRMLHQRSECSAVKSIDCRNEIREALREDGYDDDPTSLRRRLRFELIDQTRGETATRLIEEFRRHVLIPSPMVRALQTPSAGRTHADLIAALGVLGAPEGLLLIHDYLQGLASAWPDLQNNAHYHAAVEAARMIAPDVYRDFIRAAIGEGAPIPEVSPVTVMRTTPTKEATSTSCESGLGRMNQILSRARLRARRAARRGRPST